MKSLMFITLILAAVLNHAQADEAALASRWVRMRPSDAGICWVPHCGEGRLAVELARTSRLLVLAEDADWTHVAATRAAARNAGIPGSRLVVDRSELGHAPFPDNYVDLIVVADLDDQSLAEMPAKELQRVLAPHGLLVVGRQKSTSRKELTKAALTAWLKAGGIADAQVAEADGLWSTSSKPVPPGTDDWSHWFHGPDNNPLSLDTALKWPYATQWLALPYQSPQPVLTLVSDGRVFLFIGHGWDGPGLGGESRKQIMANTLIVRSAYNGQELWTRQLPDNFLIHRSCAVATPQAFYLLDEAGVLNLDPATGRECGRITSSDAGSETKWLALAGGTLLTLSGSPDPSFDAVKYNSHYGMVGDEKHEIPYGFGQQIAAYDLVDKHLLWQHREEKPVDSRLIGVRGERLYFYAPGGRAACLNIATGQDVWANGTPATLTLFDESDNDMSIGINRTRAEVLCTTNAIIFNRVGCKNMIALAPEDGHLLWSKAPGKTGKKWGAVHLLETENKLYTTVGLFDTATGKPAASQRIATVCSRITASPDAFYGQGGRSFDRRSGVGTQTQGMKVSCYEACIPAGGMLFGAPHSCVCPVSLRGQIALAPASLTSDIVETNAGSGRLEIFQQADRASALAITDRDWPMYRANLQRSGFSCSTVPATAQVLWSLPGNVAATCPVTASGLVFIGRADGTVQALAADSGQVRWEYVTGGRILASPTVWENRLYVGSGDGRVYCLEAVTGRLLWRFQAAPQRRRIMVYGALAETWPVDSGVLVTPQPTGTNQLGPTLACFSAGIASLDGVHVWAVDALTGKIVWHQGGWQLGGDGAEKEAIANRIGVYAAGGLTVDRNHLWMAGGGWVGRVCYDLADGKMAPPDFTGGPFDRNPAAEIGIFADRFIFLGGSVLYRGASEQRQSKSHTLGLMALDETGRAQYPENIIADSCITPAWDTGNLVLTSDRDGCTLMSLDVRQLVARLDQMPHKPLAEKCFQRPSRMSARLSLNTPGDPVPAARQPELKLWEQPCRTYGLVLTPHTVVVLREAPWKVRYPALADRSWSVAALDRTNGQVFWEVKLPGEPMLNGVCLDRAGNIIVTLSNGAVVCVGQSK